MIAGTRLAILALAAVALVASGRALGAQVTPPRPDSATRRDTIPRPDSLARRDSLGQRGDSTRAQRVIPWEPEDSVMSALLKREGFAVTRYQGSTVTFHADSGQIFIVGKPSIVSRDSMTLMGDTVQYNDSTQVVIARGDTLLLRNPGSGQDDIVAERLIRYDIRTREGIAREVTTGMESGQHWFVHGNVGAFKGDSTANGETAFYAVGGSLTSCDDSIPHYHFAAKEIKLISKDVMVARPAILYIADIPVMWLPFVFQDMRSGRRSGIIPPQFGFSELIRNSPTYRRTIENFGYYFVLSDYVDAQFTMDWRSNARAPLNDPGWFRLNSQVRYRWRDRFISGQLGVGYHFLRDGSRNEQYSWQHTQDFSQRTHLTANLNYVSNTTIQRNTALNPYAALQNISSQLNFQSGRGPLKYSIGGSQTQYPGRSEILRNFPNFNLSSQPIRVGAWLTWTPAITTSNQQRLHIDQALQYGFRYIQLPDGTVDSVKLDHSERNSSVQLDTPLEIFGFSWHNSFRVTDVAVNVPSKVTIRDVNDTSKTVDRIFKRTYRTDIDWQTSFNLPGLSQGRWNLVPSVQVQKVDGAFGLLVRTNLSGSRFISQPLRPAFQLSISPTLYRFFPGFGPLSQIRHTIAPQISFSYSPEVQVSDDFLAAVGHTRVGFLGANKQDVVTLHLSTLFEGKLRPSNDTAAVQQAAHVKLLSVDMSPLSYDFERARVTGKTGLTTRNVDLTLRSDLLPGFDFGTGYSLFQGDPLSDSAVFKPYRETIRASLSLGPDSPLIRALGRLLGVSSGEPGASAGQQTAETQQATPPAQFIAGQPIAGGVRRAAMTIPKGRGWTVNLSYSSQRQRPATGSNTEFIDPTAVCQQYQADLYTYDTCVRQNSGTANSGNLYQQTTLGGTYFRTPPQSNVQSTMSFHITENWAAQWATNYDFQRRQFASQVVSLQRELHDWDVTFSFTRAPNGNFAFNFYIALKAEPDLHIDYPIRDYPRGTTTPRP